MPIQEANSKKKFTKIYRIAEDGTVNISIKSITTLTNPGKFSKLGTKQIVYNPKQSTIKNLKAYSSYKGKHLEVEKKYIEDKPLASKSTGFDNNNQITISFPKVVHNAHLYYSYEMEFKPSIIGYFKNINFFMGDAIIEKGSKIVYISKKPLWIDFRFYNYPILFNESKTRDGQHQYSFSVTKDFFLRIEAEPYSVYMGRDEKIPFIAIANKKDPSAIYKNLVFEFEKKAKIESSKLNEIIKEVKSKKTLEERVDKFFAKVADTIRYMGDWRTTSGKITPRSPKDIMQNGFGDCKDFSLILTKTLRELGYNANPAILRRGGRWAHPKTKYYYDNANHMIVHVKYRNKSYWFDPTNKISFSHYQNYDIIDRTVIILEQDNIRQDYIPTPKYKDNTFASKSIYTLKKDHEIKSSKQTFLGYQAADITGYLFRSSPEKRVNLLKSSISKGYPITVESLESNSDFSSRIPQNKITIKYQSNVSKKPLLTSAGKGFSHSPPRILKPLVRDFSDYILSVDINRSYPLRQNTKIIIKDKKIIGKAQDECKITTKWIDFTKVIATKKDTIQIEYDLILKQPKIPNYELKSREFLNFQQKLRDCFDYIIIYKDK